jgi:succinate dehydrogenase / fumarate reductase membrane anchor subunit
MNMNKHNAPSIHVMRSQLSRARGLGSAKSGLHHWWMQRITSMALLPLSLYFVLSVLMLAGASRAEMAAFMAEPWNTVLYLCLIIALFYHLSLGLQVVIEDYVHNEAKRRGTTLVMNAIIVVLGLASAVSVLKLAF